MTPEARRELAEAMSERYRKASRKRKGVMLDEFCAATGCHRKYAVLLLGHPPEFSSKKKRKPGRPRLYGQAVRGALVAIWDAAGYPWSVRLKALIPAWLAKARERFGFGQDVSQQLLAMSARTMDRLLANEKRTRKRRLYGRTKPGALLKHQVPLRTDRWDVDSPGYTELDLVSHSGPRGDGEFIHSLNLTDIHSTWTETRAVKGKGQAGIVAALEQIRADLPFPLLGIDTDNGSEFLNFHMVRFCRQARIQFTRGRPYKKDDNAHIEQKNWTHVRRLHGWDRYESDAAQAAMNDLYRKEWRLMTNLFQPSVKLVSKVRVGSRTRRIYDAPTTPLDRLRSSSSVPAQAIAQLDRLRRQIDPFQLADTIERKLDRIRALADRHRPPLELTMRADSSRSPLSEASLR